MTIDWSVINREGCQIGLGGPFVHVQFRKMWPFLADTCKCHKITQIAKITKITMIAKITKLAKTTKIAKIAKIAEIT